MDDEDECWEDDPEAVAIRLRAELKQLNQALLAAQADKEAAENAVLLAQQNASAREAELLAEVERVRDSWCAQREGQIGLVEAVDQAAQDQRLAKEEASSLEEKLQSEVEARSLAEDKAAGFGTRAAEAEARLAELRETLHQTEERADRAEGQASIHRLAAQKAEQRCGWLEEQLEGFQMTQETAEVAALEAASGLRALKEENTALRIECGVARVSALEDELRLARQSCTHYIGHIHRLREVVMALGGHALLPPMDDIMFTEDEPDLSAMPPSGGDRTTYDEGDPALESQYLVADTESL